MFRVVGPSYATFLHRPGRPGSDSIPGAAFRVQQGAALWFEDVSA